MLQRKGWNLTIMKFQNRLAWKLRFSPTPHQHHVLQQLRLFHGGTIKHTARDEAMCHAVAEATGPAVQHVWGAATCNLQLFDCTNGSQELL